MALTNAERQAQGRTHDIAAPSLGLGRFSADVETLGMILLKGVLKCRRTARLVRMGGAAADNQTNYDRPRHDDHAERYDASNQQLSPQRHVHSLAPVAREDYHISAGRKSSLRRFCSPAWVAPSSYALREPIVGGAVEFRDGRGGGWQDHPRLFVCGENMELRGNASESSKVQARTKRISSPATA